MWITIALQPAERVPGDSSRTGVIDRGIISLRAVVLLALALVAGVMTIVLSAMLGGKGPLHSEQGTGVQLGPEDRGTVITPRQDRGAGLKTPSIETPVREPLMQQAATESKGYPPDPEANEALERARDLRVVAREKVVLLPDPRLWKDFAEIWRSTTADVDKAFSRRQEIGLQHGQHRLDKGQFVAYEPTQANISPEGGWFGPWDEQVNPDDMIYNVLGTKDGHRYVHHVRIAVGEDPDLDDATQRLHISQELRKEAVQRFLNAYNVAERSH